MQDQSSPYNMAICIKDMTTCDICAVNDAVRNLRPFLPLILHIASDQKLKEGKVWNEARSGVCSVIELLIF